ncbi:MAG TPA: hypothetical protein DCW42_01985 [Bacteroidetes bacterium]|nr:hypothetical protein [Bacteroidota bacterium]
MKKNNYKKIVLTLLFVLLISFMFIWVDKYFHLIQINNYAEIYLVIWQVQTAISTLSVLGLSIFTNIFNNKIYGIKYGDIVAQSIRVLGFSYWEMMILAFVLIPANIFGVLFGSMTSVIFVFLINCIAVFELIKGNIEVLVNSDETKNSCRERILKSIGTNKFDQYIQNICVDTKELYQNKDLLIFEDNFNLLKKLLESAIKQSHQEALTSIQYNLIKIFKTIVQQDTPEYIVGLLEYAIDIARTGKEGNVIIYLQNNFLSIILDQSYKNELTLDKVRNQSLVTTLTEKLLNKFSYDDSEITTDLILYLYRTIILNSDEQIFSFLTARMFSIDNVKHKSEIMSVVCVYLYYLCFYDIEFQNYTSKDRVEKLKGFIQAIPQNLPDNCFDLQSYISRNKAIFLHQYLLIKNKLDRGWEFWSVFISARSLTLDYAIVEFLTFIGYCYYQTWTDADSLCEFEVKDLLLISEYFEEDGTIKGEYQNNFSDFKVWINDEKNFLRSNQEYYRDICDTIFNKIVAYYKNRRVTDNEVIKKNFIDYEETIRQELQKSPLCRTLNVRSEKYIKEYPLLLASFFDKGKENYINLETNLREVIEQEVIRRNISCFNTVKVWFVGEDKNDNIEEINHAVDNLNSAGVKLDEYFNETISSKPYLYAFEKKDQIDQFVKRESHLRFGGKLINQHYPIYYDSSKLDISFSISKIHFYEMVSEDDIKEILLLQQKTHKGNYIFNIKGVMFALNEVKAIEYISSAYVKVGVEVKISLGIKTKGLIIEQREPNLSK